jgi:ornithine carbamoyltransferase
LPRHFLTGSELTPADLGEILERAAALKAAPLSSRALAGRSVALLFQAPSTRTRLSFEVGVFELGGHPLVLRETEMQLSRGESLEDTARVFSRHVAAFGVRITSHAAIEELAAASDVPVFNMLTELHHPCQALADLLTMRETFGRVAGHKIAYVGDGNNVARSLAVLGTLAGVEVAVASPPGYALAEGDVEGLPLTDDPREAVAGVHVFYADGWVSMGDDEAEAGARREALAPYRLDDALLDAAAPGAIALHCLPAHPGEEISAEVLYGDRQRIWDQAENRRHAQKALLEWVLGVALPA